MSAISLCMYHSLPPTSALTGAPHIVNPRTNYPHFKSLHIHMYMVFGTTKCPVYRDIQGCGLLSSCNILYVPRHKLPMYLYRLYQQLLPGQPNMEVRGSSIYTLSVYSANNSGLTLLNYPCCQLLPRVCLTQLLSFPIHINVYVMIALVFMCTSVYWDHGLRQDTQFW